jgi:tRNA-2-methylthio-N6-dimethylallyladenosine synthase
MSRRLIDAMARLEKVCRAINLPAQSGSDGVLKAMRRGYTVAEYRNLIARIRERLPDVAISNDIIAGFPGETEGQFQETVSLLSDLRFDAVHIAAYSPRPGTIAAREFADDVPAAEKKRRLQVLESLQEGIAGEINAGLQGKDVEVLVEGRQKGKWYGRTRTDKLVFFNSDENWLAKNVIVNIRRTTPWSLQGALRQ